MDIVKRIGPTRRLPPQRENVGARHIEASGPVPSQPVARGTSGYAPAGQGFRPAAGFLAQYVDQLFPWGRSAIRKDGKRQRATRAYITADMLPDLLAETLRLRTIDRHL